MATLDFEILFVEGDTSRKEQLAVHKPRSGQLHPEHPYYQRQFTWTLTKRANTHDYPYDAIDEDEYNGVRTQEIHFRIINCIMGISSEAIKEKMNSKNCFDFDYKPIELDNLTLQSEYKYEEIKTLARPYSRVIEVISFTFRNGRWEIDNDFERRVVQRSTEGIVEIKQPHNSSFAKVGQTN